MTHAHLDFQAGASGNMFLAALLDVGASRDVLHDVVNRLGIQPGVVEMRRVERAGVNALFVDVNPPTEDVHRGLSDILTMIRSANLSAATTKLAESIFRRLAEAEAEVHNMNVDDIHFHEVGAIDAMIDIVGTAALVVDLGVTSWTATPIRVGFGQVTCEHGKMPIPAPATARLLLGAPTFAGETRGEFCTPTGAAIARTLVDEFIEQPLMRVSRVGYGAGSKNPEFPNVVGIAVGERALETTSARDIVHYWNTDFVEELRTVIDDMSGEVFGHLLECLRREGALDAYATPIFTKKNRPAYEMTVLAPAERASALLDVIFRESTTIGVRRQSMKRATLERRISSVRVFDHDVAIKIVNAAEESVHPEYDDCVRVAHATGHALRVVMQEASKQAERLKHSRLRDDSRKLDKRF